MHAPSCLWNDPRARSRPRAEITNTRGDRDGPPQAWRTTWREWLSFDFTVGATSIESHASRLIYGPFRLDAIAGRVGVGATNSARLHVGTSNDDSTALIEQTLRGVVGGGILTDTAGRAATAIDLTTLWTDFHIGTVFMQQLSRVVLVLNNTSAGGQNCVGTIAITHLAYDLAADD